jgi:pyruvate,water dikinase
VGDEIVETWPDDLSDAEPDWPTLEAMAAITEAHAERATARLAGEQPLDGPLDARLELPDRTRPVRIVLARRATERARQTTSGGPTMSGQALVFEPPGPGSWHLDPVHFPRPVTRYWTEMHPEPFRRGTHEFMAYYGTLLESMETQYVNGFSYGTRHPAPEDEIPQRFARAEEVWEKKVWREQLREWDETFKPAAIKTHRELQAIDADALSDDELVAYLGRCREHHSNMIYQHMRFSGSAMLPVGDLLAHPGAGPTCRSRLRSQCCAAGPGVGGRVRELERLDRAITRPACGSLSARLRRRSRARRLSGACGSFDGEVGRGGVRLSRLVGCRLLDWLRHLRHLRPRVARPRSCGLRSGRRRRAVQGRHRHVDAHYRRHPIRQVPDEHPPSSTSCSGEARLMYRLRDERGVFSDIWASGIMRRAALAAGRRLQGKGPRPRRRALHRRRLRRDVLLGDPGAGGPSADELAAALRGPLLAHRRRRPRPSLGPPGRRRRPTHRAFPPGIARVMQRRWHRGGRTVRSSEGAARGEPAARSRRQWRCIRRAGPARLGPVRVRRILQGDVLVTESTTEAFNILLPLLGAIVTDAGGLLSHSAIVAREYGIPGVVGTRNATDLIADGTRVRVDGDAGEVTVYA